MEERGGGGEGVSKLKNKYEIGLGREIFLISLKSEKKQFRCF